MTPSPSIIEFIKQQEGFIPHAYQDIAKVWTIGYGSTRYKNGNRPVLGETITEEAATELLTWEVGLKAAAVNGFGIDVNQNQFDALVDFAYNLGIGALAGSTLLKRVRMDKNNPAIRDGFLMWNKAKINGQLVEVAGLTRRRTLEADIYFKA